MWYVLSLWLAFVMDFSQAVVQLYTRSGIMSFMHLKPISKKQPIINGSNFNMTHLQKLSAMQTPNFALFLNMDFMFSGIVKWSRTLSTISSVNSFGHFPNMPKPFIEEGAESKGCDEKSLVLVLLVIVSTWSLIENVGIIRQTKRSTTIFMPWNELPMICRSTLIFI